MATKRFRVATTINVDGNAIAKAVTAHQVRAASGPPKFRVLTGLHNADRDAFLMLGRPAQ